MISMALVKTGLSFVFGRLGFGDKILSLIENSTDNETERIRLKLQYAEKAIEAETAIKLGMMKSKVFWAVWFTAAFPCTLWLGLVFLDTSLTFVHWAIPDLPETVKPYAETILASIYGSGAAVASAEKIAAGLARRK